MMHYVRGNGRCVALESSTAAGGGHEDSRAAGSGGVFVGMRVGCAAPRSALRVWPCWKIASAPLRNSRLPTHQTCANRCASAPVHPLQARRFASMARLRRCRKDMEISSAVASNRPLPKRAAVVRFRGMPNMVAGNACIKRNRSVRLPPAGNAQLGRFSRPRQQSRSPALHKRTT